MQVTSEHILARLITSQDERAGFLPWREFMRLALFDPEFGYYSRRIADIGLRGDFTTAPVVSSLLARQVFSWQKSKRKTIPPLRRAPFIEIGAGNGDFAHEFLKCRPFFGCNFPYWIVENSPPLTDLQQKRLRKRGIRWFSTVESALQAANGHAILFSNELVDAFPCSRWVYRQNNWREWGVRIEGGKVFEATLDSPLPNSTIFAQEHLAREGQYVETHESFRDWLSRWSPLAHSAAMLTIDYGNTAAELYKREPEGSLRAYWQQQRLTGSAIYARIGRQDLTADVNFSDLQKWSEISGWEPRHPCKLADWLREQMDKSGWPMREDLPGSPEARLLDASDAGGAFMVFECEKLGTLSSFHSN